MTSDLLLVGSDLASGLIKTWSISLCVSLVVLVYAVVTVPEHVLICVTNRRDSPLDFLLLQTLHHTKSDWFLDLCWFRTRPPPVQS